MLETVALTAAIALTVSKFKVSFPAPPSSTSNAFKFEAYTEAAAFNPKNVSPELNTSPFSVPVNAAPESTSVVKLPVYPQNLSKLSLGFLAPKAHKIS